MNEIVMPKLSDTMTEGRIVSWKKRVGEAVRRGEVLAEVETDKANMELEAFASGELQEIRVEAGELAQVGTVIAVIGEAGVRASQPAKPAAAGTPPEPAVEIPLEAAAEIAPREGQGKGTVTPPADQGEAKAPIQPVMSGENQAGEAPTGAPPDSREKAAPVVRRRARELGVDLSRVKGSGPDGRILLQDLEPLAGRQEAPAWLAAPPDKAPAEGGVVPLSRQRAAIARTVSDSWRSIPHFSVTMDVLMDEAEAVLRQLKQTGIEVSLNDLIVKGVALTLRKYPYLNASFEADGIHLHGEVNIGVAVGLPDGVVVPVIPGCERLSLLEISQAAHGLVREARSGSLRDQQMSGGTISVSNLGMYGICQFVAIIYPGQGAVLAVGAVLDAVVVRSGLPVCAKIMKVTLSADHRLVDGAYAAQFLVEFKGILENPVRLLI